MPPDNKLRAPTMGSSSNSLYILAGLARRAGTAGCRKPALVTKPCPEGNFQCELPKRSSAHYGPYLDNFSAWVIFTSLFSVAADPALWEQLAAGDECLLFRNSDFVAPEQSKAFNLLTQHKQPSVRELSAFLRSCTACVPEEVPPLHSGLIYTQIDCANVNLEDHIQECLAMPPFKPTMSAVESVAVTDATGQRQSQASKPETRNSLTTVGTANLSTLLDMASSAFSAGHFADAESLYKQAFERPRLTSEDTRVARACVNLAFCYVVQNRVAEAITVFSQALAMSKSLDDYEIAVHCYCGMGIAHMLADQSAQALQVLKQVPSLSDLRSGLSALAKSALATSRLLGDLLFRIAEAYSKQHELWRALRFYQSAEDAYTKSIGPGSKEVETCKARRTAHAQSASPATGESWVCPRCSETNINSASFCYNCQNIRPGLSLCSICHFEIARSEGLCWSCEGAYRRHW